MALSFGTAGKFPDALWRVRGKLTLSVATRDMSWGGERRDAPVVRASLHRWMCHCLADLLSELELDGARDFRGGAI